jgi:hypothetical protein
LGIDEQEIDPELTYWENKAEIETRFSVVLVLNPKKADERRARDHAAAQHHHVNELVDQAISHYAETGEMNCPFCDKDYSSRVVDWVQHMNRCSKSVK